MTMTFQDTMITLAGYQSETHKVVTPDGYILTLYRLADDDDDIVDEDTIKMYVHISEPKNPFQGLLVAAPLSSCSTVLRIARLPGKYQTLPHKNLADALFLPRVLAGPDHGAPAFRLAAEVH